MSSSRLGGEIVRIHDSYIYNSVLQPQASFKSFQLTNCELKNSTVHYSYDNRDGELLITDSNVLNVSVRVFSPGDWTPTQFIVIRKSVVRDFALLLLTGSRNTPSQGLTFEHSKLNNITVKGFSTYSDSHYPPYYSVYLHVRNCTFNTGNLTLGYSSSSVHIEDSRLQDVNITSTDLNYAYDEMFTFYMRNTIFNNGIIKLPTRSVSIAYSKVTLASTPLQTGGFLSISCSSISPSPSNLEPNQIGVNATTLRMTQSSISNFYIGLRVTPPNANSVIISKSSFESNELYNIDNVGGHNVNAQGNWWGTANAGAIQNKMNDYWHDINTGQVFYANYSSVALKAEEECVPYYPSECETSPPMVP